LNDFCSDHKECGKKIFDACQAVGVATNKLIRIEDDIKSIEITIFGEGGGDSLKSRIKGTEDALSGLKELVLENREVVQTNMKGMFNVFRLTIAAASFLIIIAFGVMWAELRGVNDTVDKIQLRQIRQPLASPQLPFSHTPPTEGDR
jgi:hypothetical protein